MTFEAVADTHTIVWALFQDPRLSPRADEVLRKAEERRRKVAVSTISLVEIAYLAERQRLPAFAYERVCGRLADPDQPFIEVPVSQSIADALRHVSRDEVADMPDRIIAATALHLNVPVITRDGRIRSSSIESVW